ncbi:MAG: MMPL family transporter [Pirellulaceae bacterium]
MQTRRRTFFERYALLILMGVFFLVPFGLRGAKLSLQRMKNDVKDWLPDDFAETTELDWFRDHFLGEQFVLVSWDGCTADDQRLGLLAALLIPSEESRKAGVEPPEAAGQPRDTNEPRIYEIEDFIGDQLGLHVVDPDFHFNWGGRNEKWLKGNNEQWYFILENGEIHHWEGQSTVVGAASRAFERIVSGGNQAQGEYVRTVDPIFYERPRKLQAQLFKSVVTGPQVLDQLSEPGGPLLRDEDASPREIAAAQAEAKRRLTGTLFGPDGKQTCLVATLSEAGKVDLRRTLGRGVMGRPRGRLLELAEQAGISEEQGMLLRMGGPPVDNVAIDEEGERTLARLVSFSVLLGVGLAYLCLRSIKLTMMVFFVGGVSAVTSLSLVWWLGETVFWWLDGSTDAVMMSMPAVVYVLGLSGAIHVINYYRDAVEETGTLRGAPELAIAHGWYPCTVAAVTTAIGLGSLATSSIMPIHKFGIFSAVGVLATLVLLFTYLPSALEIWPPKPRKKKKSDEPSLFALWVNRLGTRIGDYVITNNVSVAVICLVGFAFMAYGLQYIHTSVHLLKMFDNEARIIKDYEWLEANMGKLVPMELVVRVEPEMIQPAELDPENAEEFREASFQLSFLERMEITKRISQVVEDSLGPDGAGVIGPSTSALTFAPTLPEVGGGTQAFALRGAYNRRLYASFDEFVQSDYLRVDKENDAELWRLSLRLGALDDIDYGIFVYDVKRVVEPVMAAYRAREQILRRIDSDRNGEGFTNVPVALMGVNYISSAEPSAGPIQPVEAPATDEELDKRLDQIDTAQIFTETLRDLLITSRVRFVDYDPAAHTEDRLAFILDRYEYLVTVDDFPGMDSEAVQAKGDKLIDVRGFDFDRGDTIPAMYDAERASVTVVYTGVVPVVYKAARTLLVNLVESTMWAFGLIAIVMWIVLKSLRAGLLSMIPNIFPVVFIFGLMGWLGIKVDIGTMMTASVAMGVAVDDTVHFLTWFRWGLNKGLDRRGAIKEAYARCATAMFQTTIIGGLGLAVFALSTFTPTQRFGYMMVSLLVAALVGDLIFLPALLAGPLGHWFRPDKKRAGSGPPLKTTEEDRADLHETDTSEDDQDEPNVIPVSSASRPDPQKSNVNPPHQGSGRGGAHRMGE